MVRVMGAARVIPRSTAKAAVIGTPPDSVREMKPLVKKTKTGVVKLEDNTPVVIFCAAKPSYFMMVVEACFNFGHKVKGTSRQAIKHYVHSVYGDQLKGSVDTYLAQAIKRGVEEGKLKYVKGSSSGLKVDPLVIKKARGLKAAEKDAGVENSAKSASSGKNVKAASRKASSAKTTTAKTTTAKTTTAKTTSGKATAGGAASKTGAKSDTSKTAASKTKSTFTKTASAKAKVAVKKAAAKKAAAKPAAKKAA